MYGKKKERERDKCCFLFQSHPHPNPHTNTCIPTITEIVGMLGTWPGQGCVGDTVGLV